MSVTEFKEESMSNEPNNQTEDEQWNEVEGAPVYGRTPRGLIRSRHISPVAKTVFAYLEDRGNDDVQDWPSYETIAASIGGSAQEAESGLNELIADDWIIKQQKRTADGQPCHFVYHVNLLRDMFRSAK